MDHYGLSSIKQHLHCMSRQRMLSSPKSPALQPLRRWSGFCLKESFVIHIILLCMTFHLPRGKNQPSASCRVFIQYSYFQDHFQQRNQLPSFSPLHSFLFLFHSMLPLILKQAFLRPPLDGSRHSAFAEAKQFGSQGGLRKDSCISSLSSRKNHPFNGSDKGYIHPTKFTDIERNSP